MNQKQPSMIRIVMVLGALCASLSVIFAFQNCENFVGDETDKNQSIVDKWEMQGDDGYHGGFVATPREYNNLLTPESSLCLDGSPIKSTIERNLNGLFLIRENCEDIEPKQIWPHNIFPGFLNIGGTYYATFESDGFLVYNDTLFTVWYGSDEFVEIVCYQKLDRIPIDLSKLPDPCVSPCHLSLLRYQEM